MLLQTWKLREEERLLDIVDPELTKYPEDDVIRFIKVALFCTQAAPHQRPTIKQVVNMLSKPMQLNEKALTKPNVYKHFSGGPGGSSGETSSSQKNKAKQSVDPSTHVPSSPSITQMLPR